MNYTKPENIERDDNPLDWLTSCLIFAKSLSKILDENQGIVIDLENDMIQGEFQNINRVLVYKESNQIKIMEFNEDDLNDGDIIYIDFED